MSFKDKVVIVTGASSGIGAATAEMFAREGARVVLVARGAARLAAAEARASAAACASGATSSGGATHALVADVAKDAARVIAETVQLFGRLDVLVNNAGFGAPGSILGGDFLQAYDQLMPVNLRAAIELTVLAAPHLLKTRGNIVNISSVAAKSLPKDITFMPYCVSKAALDHFTRGSALELGPQGVRVNSVNPGPVATDFFNVLDIAADVEQFKDMTLLGRVSQPEDIANLVLFLASDKASSITGRTYVMDEGYLLKHSIETL